MIPPFTRKVIELLGKAKQGVDSHELRRALMRAGFGKHPAGVAMNLTMLAWRGKYVTCYVDDHDCRIFMLTSEGRDEHEKL